MVDGPGTSFAAHIAFMRGNPAITLGSTIYFKQWLHRRFLPGPRRTRELHPRDDPRLAICRARPGPFFARYPRKLAKVGGNPDKLYQYKAGEDLFTKATLEAQAQMVEDYSRALWGKNAARHRRTREESGCQRRLRALGPALGTRNGRDGADLGRARRGGSDARRIVTAPRSRLGAASSRPAGRGRSRSRPRSAGRPC